MIKKFFSPFCLIISILILIYTFYRSEIYWSGINRYFYIQYYTVSFILIICSILTFFISEKTKLYLVVILSSIIFSLYLFEGYMYFSGDDYYKNLTNLRAKQYEKINGKKFDRRNLSKAYKDLKKENANLVLSIQPVHHKKSSLYSFSGISKSKTIYCNENGNYWIYDSDRYGFNNPNDEWNKKNIEYFLVGDSFTHGNCVNRPNDIASVLRSQSSKAVLNLGMRGNGPLIEYSTLREYLPSNVKKILWLYYEENDLENLEEEFKSEFLRQYLDNKNFSQNLKSKQDQLDVKLNEVIKKRYKSNYSKLLKFLKLYNLRSIINIEFNKRNIIDKKDKNKFVLEQFKKILILTKDLAEKNNSKLYFIYLPEYSRYKMANYNNQDYEKIKKITDKLNLPFIDIHEKVFKKEKNPLKLFPFELPGHYNVAGYKKVAETIYRLTSN